MLRAEGAEQAVRGHGRYFGGLINIGDFLEAWNSELSQRIRTHPILGRQDNLLCLRPSIQVFELELASRRSMAGVATDL